MWFTGVRILAALHVHIKEKEGHRPIWMFKKIHSTTVQNAQKQEAMGHSALP